MQSEIDTPLKNIVLRSGRENDLFLAGLKEPSRLKQHYLFFDQIGILRLENLRQVMKASLSDNIFGNKLQSFISDTEWLEENGIVFEPKIDSEFTKNLDTILHTDINTANELRKLNVALKHQNEKQEPEGALNKHNAIKEKDAIILRMLSLAMEAHKNMRVSTTLPFSEYIHELPNSQRNSVIQIVINKLPIPNDSTPWESLIDYRNDPDNRKNLLALRRWIRNLSAKELPEIEIKEEIEWLLNELQDHMKFHKMKANTETLEVMIKAPLEIIENLIKFKFSKIPEPLFALKKRQINLMEAELRAPNRELAYIIKTKESFESLE
jgi:hypothetical protein